MVDQFCQNCKGKFHIEDADIEFYKKMDVPLPTFCPDCRFQRRLSYLNIRNLYSRKLSYSEKSVISIYSPDKNFNIVEDKDWYSDKYDFTNFGKDYDFHKPFFLQFRELMEQVPLPHLQRQYSTFENSDYCNAASGLKNCYLVFSADLDQDCYYGYSLEEAKDCMDVIFTNKSELCYEGVNLKNCYNCLFCEDLEGSNGMIFCRDCVGCNDCFGSIGLRQKSYYIFNKPYSKEEYQKKIAEFKMSSWSSYQKIKKEVEEFFLSVPRKFIHGRNNLNVEGDYVYQSKNVQESFMVEKAEDCKFTHLLRYLTTGTNNSYDYTMYGCGAELIYESAWCGLNIHNLKFSLWNYGSSDLEYCFGCHYSTNLFGCIGLQHKKYCILNKQYTEDEYKALLPKIKEQMKNIPYKDKKGNIYRYGEFFPNELSPFDYNQTLAQEFCPITKEESLNQNYGWYENKERVIGDFTHWKDLADDIESVDDRVLTKPILCKAYEENSAVALRHNCSQIFKIIPQELGLYRKMGVPLPRYCPNTRCYQKLKQLNPFKLWQRECTCKATTHGHPDMCDKIFETSYKPDRKEMVHCEECYLKEVY
ncbi:MAG: hypothetical protein WC843_05620 [Candidatus Gracilibacteria bacterium]|jgi:hypothetical protein